MAPALQEPRLGPPHDHLHVIHAQRLIFSLLGQQWMARMCTPTLWRPHLDGPAGRHDYKFQRTTDGWKSSGAEFKPSMGETAT